MEQDKPQHPGELIRELCIEGRGVTITAAAAGIKRYTGQFQDILAGRRGLSPETAARLKVAFGLSTETVRDLLHMQADVDLWNAEHKPDRVEVQHFTPNS